MNNESTPGQPYLNRSISQVAARMQALRSCNTPYFHENLFFRSD